MGQVDAQVYYTYQSNVTENSVREDLIDVITNIDPIDTYVTSVTANARAKQRYHEWDTDALSAAGPNAIQEGYDWDAAAITPPSRTGNYCQILRKQFAISDTLIATDTVGNSGGMGYQTAKHLKELARDIEYALVINSASASGASATARKMLGINGWITDNVTTGTAATASEALTETMVNQNLQEIWADGGQPSVMLMGGFQKRAFEGFYTRQKETTNDTKKVTPAVDVFNSTFGPIMLKLHHQMNTTLASVIITLGDMSLWQKAWLRPIKPKKIAATGSAEKYFIEAELTLESRQEKGSGKIVQLSTS